jgi:cell division protein FtsB
MSDEKGCCNFDVAEMADRICRLERDVQKFLDYGEDQRRQYEAERNRNHELRQQINELRAILDLTLQAYHRVAAAA